MSVSTLPAESAAAITAWLRNQPVCRQAVVTPSHLETSAASAASTSPPRRVEKFAVAAPRRSGLLLRSLRTLQSSGENYDQTTNSVATTQKSGPQPSPSSVNRSPVAPSEAEQIDPLPDFDLGSLFDQDHCVFVGNRRRTETADWLPVTAATVTPPSPTESLVKELTEAIQPSPAPSPPLPSEAAARSKAGNGMDRRAYPRHDSGGVVTVCRRSVANRLFVRASDLSWQLHSSGLKGRLIDVSMTGMALAMPEPLPEGTPISMQVSSRSLDRPAEVTGHVLRCTPIEGQLEGSHNWRMVCQLDNRLTFEQVHSLGKQMFAYTMV